MVEQPSHLTKMSDEDTPGHVAGLLRLMPHAEMLILCAIFGKDVKQELVLEKPEWMSCLPERIGTHLAIVAKPVLLINCLFGHGLSTGDRSLTEHQLKSLNALVRHLFMIF